MNKFSNGARFLSILCILIGFAVRAEVEAEKGAVQTLQDTPSPHWVWISDIVFNHMEGGKAFLVDADAGQMLGMLSTGFMFSTLLLPKDYGVIYSPEVYYSRGTRGERTDVVTVYDPKTLSPIDEIVIPPKRISGLSDLNHFALSDDDRFAAIYNYSPAQSLSIIDTESRKFVGEIDTSGCALAYAGGPRRFHMLCNDARMLTVTIDDSGKLVDKQQSEPFFDIENDFVLTRAVRYLDTWLFVSQQGYVYPVDVSGDLPKFDERWSLVSARERGENWKIGGIQAIAVHQKGGHLYALMHQGGDDTHKDPGIDVWVFDLAMKQRVQTLKLQHITTSIQISQDDNPLLYTIFAGSPSLDVYDAVNGEFLRTVGELGFTPMVLQTP
jgi:methylamine dehydrogenase heavy chain